MKREGPLYICDRCGGGIMATSKDPVHCTSLGRMHGKCMIAASTDVQQKKTSNRSIAQRMRRQADELPDLSPENGFEKVGPPGRLPEEDEE